LSDKDADVLTIGFARRFATYKRAALLFSDPQRLARLISSTDRPVLILFAGKAHPNDRPGQHLIKIIHDFARRPEFQGRIIIMEGYDMALARILVSGVDVWLNNPEFPMEASGTSGEKAGINGVINLSVLDGWWGEGYQGDNGWAIATHGPEFDSDFRNREEAHDLLDILEHEVIPLYYERNGRGYSEGWVKMSKNSMRTILPNFNAQRMVGDYVTKFYGPAARQCRKLSTDNKTPARTLARWKQTVADQWSKIQVHRLDNPTTELLTGEMLPIKLAVYLAALSPQDVIVECLVGTEGKNGKFITHACHQFSAVEVNSSGETIYTLDLEPPLPGLQYYKLRLYPYHRLLTHPLETGYMIWL
jgi:starch phosphorylase